MPLEADTEITGTPILTVAMSSTAADGALHAYLEDVSPEGWVTYVDEGMLRIMDRKPLPGTFHDSDIIRTLGPLSKGEM